MIRRFVAEGDMFASDNGGYVLHSHHEGLINKKDDRISELEYQQQLLINAIADAAKKHGIINDDVVLTGPQSLMVCDDIESLADKAQPHIEPNSKDVERYHKLRGWMSSNVKEGWTEVERLAAISCYLSWEDFDQYLDELDICNVGLMQKSAEN